MKSRSGHPTLRVGSGRLRGRLLLPPPGRTTRPMTGLAKKSLFTTLAPRLADAVVLDGYAGTGTMGIEAISNGAAHAAFAEKNHRVAERLKRNLAEMDIETQTTVWTGNIETHLDVWLAELGRSVDVAFLDPPFPAVREWDWSRLADRVFAPLADALAEAGVVVLRTPDDRPPPETIAGMEAKRTKTFGQMTITFYEHAKKF